MGIPSNCKENHSSIKAFDVSKMLLFRAEDMQLSKSSTPRTWYTIAYLLAWLRLYSRGNLTWYINLDSSHTERGNETEWSTSLPALYNKKSNCQIAWVNIATVALNVPLISLLFEMMSFYTFIYLHLQQLSSFTPFGEMEKYLHNLQISN